MITDGQSARDQAFRDMVTAGMTVYQIAQATGLGDGSVRYWLRELRLEAYKTGTMPPKTPRVAIKRRENSGSVLFGD